jgi:hypothetical protein
VVGVMGTEQRLSDWWHDDVENSLGACVSSCYCFICKVIWDLYQGMCAGFLYLGIRSRAEGMEVAEKCKCRCRCTIDGLKIVVYC